jgi:hypothetical protein
LENDLLGTSGAIAAAAQRIDNIVSDYFTENSFSVYDYLHSEILFVEPSKDFSIVLNVTDFSWTIRKDVWYMGAGDTQLLPPINMNNKDVIVGNTVVDNGSIELIERFALFGLEEEKASKNIAKGSKNNVVLFATSTLFVPNYTKIEHLIARYFQNADDQHKSNIYLYIIGSRNGVEWKIVHKGKLSDVNRAIQGIQIRRCFVSCRYFQFVFARKNTNTPDLDRLMNNFSGFSFEYQNFDNERKLR